MNKLITNYENILSRNSIMICFPFAGGGSRAFNEYVEFFKGNITVCPVQLPGREQRIMDKPYTNIELLVRDLVSEIKMYKDNEIILFGHSMGAKIAYELAKKLEEEGYYIKLLIVSGSPAPHIPEPNPIHNLSDEEFKNELYRFNATPKEILENKEILSFFLPMLKADFTMSETYCVSKIVPLECPILALGGDCDKEADEVSIREWSNYTKKEFYLSMFEGEHFFINEKKDEVCRKISEVIKKYI